MYGTTCYLARGPSEEADKQRGRLRAYVWRMSMAADGLYNDNVGPSLYVAKQGRPVKVWGFLANGHLCIHVLDADGASGTTHMTGPVLRRMLDRYGKQWVARCWSRRPAVVRVVMDYETCLRQEESLKCFCKNGLHPLVNYPRSSQDLNAIENVLSLLKSKLEDEAPDAAESREDFIARLRAGVRYWNSTQKGRPLAA